ncbi:MAG: DUF2309 domain-containing protein [Halohasta sp.]
MSTDQIHDSIEQAATAVGAAWPLHSFVTANPLSGFEDRPFHEAAAEAERLFGSDGYPEPAVFRRAWEAESIDPTVLDETLADHGYDAAPAELLDRMAEADPEPTHPAQQPVDRVLTKWLAAFLDEGRTEWPMPNREQGFYESFRTVARHDRELPTDGELPAEPIAAIEAVVDTYPADRWETIFEYHLTALPGWTGLLKQRADGGDDWQSAYPITLTDYLAARLTVADLLDVSVAPPAGWESTVGRDVDAGDVPLAEVWLTAWERSYRGELVGAVADASASLADTDDEERPAAQLVFCIDTRSEIIRRHIESTGDYETHGYAGFFGVPMRYQGYDTEAGVDACPPIVETEHRIVDRPTGDCEAAHQHHDRWQGTVEMGEAVLKSLKANAATAFSFVESAGAGYAAALAGRTLVPDRLAAALEALTESPHAHEFCEPTVDYNPDGVHELREGLTHDEKVEYAATAFELMGIERTARLVVFTGHASETANNPFGSSLDCGACAGSPGGPNARVLATICNDTAVKDELRARGIDIPEDTVFVAGEHTTTTDDVTLYAGSVPESHAADLDRLRTDLAAAREAAATERADALGADDAADVDRRAADWAETRPEWGLAGNAGFVIGPRELTAGCDLDGRSFLHSYDWSTDVDGEALETIMTGPMVVTQWINTQYYFATVDTAAFGSGSKVTHNPVGNVGVYQGNGGDILTGLPLQSVAGPDGDPYHQPLRLSTVIHAPVDRVTEILTTHEEVAELLDNGWLSLTVVDPTQDHRAFEYVGDLEWTPVEEPEPSAAEPAPAVAADD